MKTVLTIDDSAVARSVVARALGPWMCHCVGAKDGMEGLGLAREVAPDLIILDIQMPEMDGQEVLRTLRQDPATAAIPVVVLSGALDRDRVVELGQLGMEGCLVKPFSNEGFAKALSPILGPPPAPETVQAIDARAILVVDDSERVLASAREALGESLKVLTARGAREAADVYHAHRPGVVVIDLDLPDVDGFETLNQLRKLGRSGYVAMAHPDRPEEQDRARRFGYHSVLAKPFHAMELVEKLVHAAGYVVPAERVVQYCFAEVAGCPLLRVPRPRTLARLLPELRRALQTLADEGSRALVVDVSHLEGTASEEVRAVVSLYEEITRLGLRVALCTASDLLLERLGQISETQEALHASTLEEARACL